MQQCKYCNREVVVREDTDGVLLHDCPNCGPVVVPDMSRAGSNLGKRLDYMVDRSTWK